MTPFVHIDRITAAYTRRTDNTSITTESPRLFSETRKAVRDRYKHLVVDPEAKKLWEETENWNGGQDDKEGHLKSEPEVNRNVSDEEYDDLLKQHEKLTAELELIKNSKAWRLAEFFRRMIYQRYFIVILKNQYRKGVKRIRATGKKGVERLRVLWKKGIGFWCKRKKRGGENRAPSPGFLLRKEEGAKGRWDFAFETDHAFQEDINKIYTFASPLFWELHGDKCLNNNSEKESRWLSWLVRTYKKTRPEVVLELGSGNGDLILELSSIGFAGRYEGIDLSESGVRVAREKAIHQKCDNVEYRIGDLNAPRLSENIYDMVVAQMCIHHIENLEGLFGEVEKALKPDGIFVIFEYVGPSRWQFTFLQLLLANLFLAWIPKRYRYDATTGKTKKMVLRPTIGQMIEMGPSEAVRSEEIVPLFERYFTVDHQIEFGGGVYILVLENIVSNFRRDDETSLKWFKRILGVDGFATKRGWIPNANVLLAGRPRRDNPTGSRI